MYGGVNIICAGDFHQIRPVTGNPVYKKWNEHWQGSINCSIFLKNDHRFKDDPLYGQILGRMRMGEVTKEDIECLNKRWIGNKDAKLPKTGEICYACPYNKDCNAIST